MKNFNKTRIWESLTISVLLAVAASAQAGSVSGLTVFTANTTAKASEVDGNFTSVTTAVNDNDSRLTTVEGKVGTNTNSINTLVSGVNSNAINIDSLQTNPSITGNLTLPESTSSVGNIYKGTIPFLSSYGVYNVFLGENAGNYSMTGTDDVADGYEALYSNTSGSRNNAIGYQTLYANTTGHDNTGNGLQALFFNTTGNYNTGNGAGVLTYNTTGSDNTADGFDALFYNTTGSYNIAIGNSAGINLDTGNYNIDVGNQGVASESGTIRIGDSSNQANTYIAGISGVTVTGGTAVIIDSNGHLGTSTSSRRFKDHIHAMGKASDILNKLKPVTYYYKTDHDPEGRHLQYGLVAEDVQKVAPSLVVYGKDGKPDGVYYRFLAPMLLNQYQKQQKVIAADTAMLKKQAKEIVALRKEAAQVAVLEKQMAHINNVLAMRQSNNEVASAASALK